jgi:hypothetical protein
LGHWDRKEKCKMWRICFLPQKEKKKKVTTERATSLTPPLLKKYIKERREFMAS